MCKYGESNRTRIMMATVPHVTSGLRQKILGRWIFVDTSVQAVKMAEFVSNVASYVVVLCVILF